MMQSSLKDQRSWSSLRLFFLGGLSNGLPAVLTWQTLNIWLAQLGHSKSLIGFVFLSGIPYSLKVPFSWIIDSYQIPFLSKYYGHRRSWAIVLQIFLACFILILGITTGTVHIYYTMILCFIVSLLSMMNQIATVTHRIEQIDPEYTPPAAASGIFGYRLGKFIGRAGALYLLAWWSWSWIYGAFSMLFLLTMLSYMTTEDRISSVFSKRKREKPSRFSLKTLWREMIQEPFLLFSQSHKHWLMIVLLLMSLNLGDALILGMVDIFYLEQGYSTFEIASITKSFGLICTVLGGIVAAYTRTQSQILWLLWASSLMHLGSQGLLISLSLNAHNPMLLAITVFCDQFSGGMRATLIATWISHLCSREGLAARQYAFFASLKAIPYFMVASVSGILADHMTWPTFFLTSLALSLPSFLMLSIGKYQIFLNSHQINPSSFEKSYIT